MDSIISFNLNSLPSLFTLLNVNEMKLVFVIAYYLKNNNRPVFINNAENREWLSNFGFKRSPERISSLLSSLTRKGFLVREGIGVFSLSENLII